MVMQILPNIFNGQFFIVVKHHTVGSIYVNRDHQLRSLAFSEAWVFGNPKNEEDFKLLREFNRVICAMPKCKIHGFRKGPYRKGPMPNKSLFTRLLRKIRGINHSHSQREFDLEQIIKRERVRADDLDRRLKRLVSAEVRRDYGPGRPIQACVMIDSRILEDFPHAWDEAKYQLEMKFRKLKD